MDVFLQIVNRHGPEADRHLLRCLFSHVDFSGDGKSSGKDFHQVKSAVGLFFVGLMRAKPAAGCDLRGEGGSCK